MVREEHGLPADVQVQRHHVGTIGQDAVALVAGGEGEVGEVAREVADVVLGDEENLWLGQTRFRCQGN